MAVSRPAEKEEQKHLSIYTLFMRPNKSHQSQLVQKQAGPKQQNMNCDQGIKLLKQQ